MAAFQILRMHGLTCVLKNVSNCNKFALNILIHKQKNNSNKIFLVHKSNLI